ncbi:MAG: right-handed parallel beta-helix repeat-containing protein [Thermoplasmata archaeon]
MEGSKSGGATQKVRTVAYALLVASLALFSAILMQIIFAELAYEDSSLKVHEPIRIVGNSMLSGKSGVVRGSGSETDPYVIEGWTIRTASGAGISINDTDVHLTLRNIRVINEGTEESASVGILLTNASNVEVESCFVYSFSCGINVTGRGGDASGSGSVTRCTLEGNTVGICLNCVSGWTVAYCFLEYSDQALRVQNSSQVEFSYTEIRWSHVGLLLDNVTDCLVKTNNIGDGFVDAEHCRNATFIDNSGGATYIIANSSEMVLSHNYFSDGRGIQLQGCSNASIEANLLMPGANQYSSMAGISVIDSHDSAISSNQLIRSRGIVVRASHELLVAHNYVSQAGYGQHEQMSGLVVYDSCRNLTISRNSLVDCTGRGMSVYDLNHATIEQNNISGNNKLMHDYYYIFDQYSEGVYIRGSNLSIRDNLISDNTVTPLSGQWYQSKGLMLAACLDSTFERNRVSDTLTAEGCNNLTLSANVFEGNWNISVWQASSILPSSRISFVGNNFVGDGDVVVNVWGDVVLWNASYPEGGNYWSSYVGQDLMSGEGQNLAGSDGFGDTPRHIDGGTFDCYPRMTAVPVDDTVQPCTTALVNGTIGKRMYYLSDVQVTLKSFDAASSVSEILYSLDSGGWQVSTSGITIPGEGTHELRYYAVDSRGNREEAGFIVIAIDSEAPFSASPLKREYVLRADTAETQFIGAKFDDNTSGFMSSKLCFWDTASDIVPVIFGPGTESTEITAWDSAGNSRSYTLLVSASVSPLSKPLDPQGPYGYWLQIEMLAGTGAFLSFLVAIMVSRRPSHPTSAKWEPRSEGERHYDEEVVNGYPKFMKKI